jgi:ferritin-like protein
MARLPRGRFPLVLVGALLALSVAGCGSGGGGGGGTETERNADATLLNQMLGRQLGAVAAYEQVIPHLRGADRVAARKFRAEEQEHVDATVKVLRGIGAEADPPAETIEGNQLESSSDYLHFLYDLESATIDAELSLIGKLATPWPRPLFGSMAANQAQRLVLIRRALGATPLEAIGSAFEDGNVPAP